MGKKRRKEEKERGEITNCLDFIAAAPELPPAAAPGPTPRICVVFPKFLVAILPITQLSFLFYSNPLCNLKETGLLSLELFSVGVWRWVVDVMVAMVSCWWW